MESLYNTAGDDLVAPSTSLRTYDCQTTDVCPTWGEGQMSWKFWKQPLINGEQLGINTATLHSPDGTTGSIQFTVSQWSPVGLNSNCSLYTLAFFHSLTHFPFPFQCFLKLLLKCLPQSQLLREPDLRKSLTQTFGPQMRDCSPICALRVHIYIVLIAYFICWIVFQRFLSLSHLRL